MTAEEIRRLCQTCVDCGGQLHEIRLMESLNGYPAWLGYVPADAKSTGWGGQYRAQGKVLTFMCSACARIFHYGTNSTDST